MLKRVGLPALLLFSAVVLLAGRDLIDRVTPTPNTPQGPRSDRPAYTMDRVHSRRYNDQGRLIRDLTAIHVINYDDQRGSILTEPLLTAHAETGEPWLLKARTGTASDHGQDVFLEGDVRVDRAASQQNAEMHLETDKLRVVPERNYAETESPVTLTSPGARTQGVGMTAHFEQEKLQLLNQVRGQYEPTSPRRAPRS